MDPENRFTLDLEEIYKTHGPLIPSAPPLASPVSSPSSNDKGVATVEQTGPPTPKEGKVINFETVSKGIHRSSFPHPTNLEHLASLKLKTIVTLVEEPYAPQTLQFVEANKISLLRIPILAHKSAERVNSLAQIARVMQILGDQSMHPVLVHCNKGKHRTGCIIATYRLLNSNTLSASEAIAEYRHYAGAKRRFWDEHFISTLSLPHLNELLRVGPNSLAGQALATQQMRVSLEENRKKENELMARYPTPPASDFDEDDARMDSGIMWQMNDGTEEGMNPS